MKRLAIVKVLALCAIGVGIASSAMCPSILRKIRTASDSVEAFFVCQDDVPEDVKLSERIVAAANALPFVAEQRFDLGACIDGEWDAIVVVAPYEDCSVQRGVFRSVNASACFGFVAEGACDLVVVRGGEPVRRAVIPRSVLDFAKLWETPITAGTAEVQVIAESRADSPRRVARPPQ